MTKKQRKGRKEARSRQKGLGRWLYVVIPILAVLLIGAGRGLFFARRGDAGATRPEIQLAPVSQLSQQVRSAPPVVQEAYRFAIANPEVLSNLPCYCGCGSVGHESNLDCFIQEFKPGESIVFDDHAFG